MSPTAPADANVHVSEETLREVIEKLAPVERRSCSDGERHAAAWIADRLRDAGCDVSVEHEEAWGPWPPNLIGVGLVATLGALLVIFKRRLKGIFYSLVALAGLIDEVQNGPRLFRRIFRTKKKTINVVATTGDRSATRTLVVLAHHDAAQTGAVFNQSWAMALHEMNPQLMTRSKNQIPQWWLGVAPPLLTIVSAVTRWRRPARWAFRLALLGTAAVWDIDRSPTVPGANDNLSGVATLVGLAEALKERPVEGLRVILVSAGAEEALQEGIRAYLDRHRAELDHATTWFLNTDTVGSPHLVLLEGEGPIWMEDYTDPTFRSLVAECAVARGIDLEVGVRARASTDGIIPSRAGYPTATLVSVMPWRLPGNYHLMTDTPGNVEYSTIVDTVRLAYAVGERLARS
ncbi:MAG: M28 family peptidase [Actinobacteria bacterium]|nr:M28 family peptidase [Actinomycetota bacterium]